jgi:transcriptional regulator with XRE-family HTH domain
MAARLTVPKLARLAECSVSTIQRVEQHKSSSELTLLKIIDALNTTDVHKKNPIKPEVEISAKSKYGTKPDEDQTS